MDSSRGRSRPPVFHLAFRLSLAVGFLGISSLVHPEAAAAQPSPDLLSWLRAQEEDAVSVLDVLGVGPEVEVPAIPPGSVIGEVRIVNQDIFDPSRPGEDRKVFRFANRLHRTTRPGVIVSLIIGAVEFWIGPKAVTIVRDTVREIRQRGDDG